MIKQIVNFSSGIDLLNHENILPLKYAKYIKNFDFTSGALKNDIRFYLYSLFEDDTLYASVKNLNPIKKLYFFKKYDFINDKSADKLIFITSDKNVYYINLFDQVKTVNSLGITFNEIPVGIGYRLNGEDVFIFASKSDSMTVWDGVTTPVVIADAPKIASMAIHYERLFVTTTGDYTNLWFSDDLDPTNWNISLEDAGMISMPDERGALRKVISFNNYLYIFRDYGISRLSASGAQSEFSLTHLFISAGKIYPETISLCGDRIIFVASDGMYAFDGLSTHKILANVFPIFSSFDGAVSSYSQGKYYLSCKTKGDSGNLDSLFIYDISLKKYTLITDVKFSSILNINMTDSDALLFLEDTLSNDVLEISNSVLSNRTLKKSNFSAVWRSGLTEFGYVNSRKTIRKLYIYAKTAGTIKVTTDEEVCDVYIDAGKYSYPCLISGTRFMFEISSTKTGDEFSDLMVEFGMQVR